MDKRILPITIIIIGLVFLLNYGTVTTFSQEPAPQYNITYILNPGNTTETADPMSMLKTYIVVLDDYLNNIDSLHKLEPIMTTNNGLPKDLRYTASEYTIYLNDLLIYINETKTNYYMAKQLVENKEYDEAIEYLYKTGYYLSKANITMGLLQQSWPSLYTLLLKYSTEDIRPQLTEYAILLQQLLKELQLLLQEYLSLQIKVYLELQEALININQTNINDTTSLTNTTIIIHEYNTTIKPGHTFLIEGVLVENITGKPLSDKTLRIVFLSSQYIILSKKVITDSNGTFTLKTIIPEYFIGIEAQRNPRPGVYTFETEIVITYQPEDNDTNLYRGAIKYLDSNYTYIVPQLTVDGPSLLMPGKKYTYRINHPVNDTINLMVSLPGVFKLTTIYSPNTQKITFQLPANTPVGDTRLFFTTPIYKEYYEASLYYPIRIVMEDYIVELEEQKPIFYPVIKPVIKGKVLNKTGLPIPNVLVTDNETIAYTDENGEFTLNVNIGFIPLISDKEVILIVNTTRPWNPIKTITVHLPVINLPLIIAGLSYIVGTIIIGPKLFAGLGTPLSLFYFKRKAKLEIIGEEETPRTKKPSIKERKQLPKQDDAKKDEHIALEAIQYGIEVSELYESFMKNLSKIASPLSYETLREYTQRIQRQLGSRPNILEVSIIFEKWIYGEKTPSKDEINKIKQVIKELANVFSAGENQ